MSDDDWLRAIERYSSSSSSSRNSWCKAERTNSRESLRKQTEQDPYRFAKLIASHSR